MQNHSKKYCQFCGDPAKIINIYKKPYWPFEIDREECYCYECHLEIKGGKIPKVTDPSHQSRRGSGMKKRRRLMEE
tara:strand:+ start:857 stop:1084 length:228 start_codon:yes stop_codon:yes gene_type:complete